MSEPLPMPESPVSLGVLPEVYARFVEAIADPGVRAARVAAVVRVDPALTAATLRLAQARAGEPISTVSRAVLVLDAGELRSMTRSLQVLQMFRGLPEHLIDMRSFWTHSVAVALLCHALASRLGWQNTEALFVAGLLHDLGTLRLCTGEPSRARRVLVATENAERPADEVERELLGRDHAELGAQLLVRWGLPVEQVQAVRFHHRPADADPQHRSIVDLVHVADVAVSALQLGNAGERAANRLDREAWTRTGLTLDDMDAGLDELDQRLVDLSGAVLEPV